MDDTYSAALRWGDYRDAAVDVYDRDPAIAADEFEFLPICWTNLPIVDGPFLWGAIHAHPYG